MLYTIKPTILFLQANKLVMAKALSVLTICLSTTFSAWGADPEQPSSSFFCCKDAKGQRNCGDYLPQACQKRPYTTYSANGSTIKRVKKLSEADRLTAQTEGLIKNQEKKNAIQQSRQDVALLQTYPNLFALDKTREKLLSAIEDEIFSSEDAISNANKKLKALKNKDSKEATDYQSLIQSNTQIVMLKKREHSQVKARFDNDKKRFIELKKSQKKKNLLLP